MSDPTKILDAAAKKLYDAWCVSADGQRAAYNPFTGTYTEPEPWNLLDNHLREIWRGKALAALRSEESVADELKREERASAEEEVERHMDEMEQQVAEAQRRHNSR